MSRERNVIEFLNEIKNKSTGKNLEKVLSGKASEIEVSKTISSLITHSLIELEKSKDPKVTYESLCIPQFISLLSSLVKGEIDDKRAVEDLKRLYKGDLKEVSYKQVKAMSASEDPVRIAKSKTLRTKYIGLNKYGDLMFKTTSETTPGRYWYQTIRLNDFDEAQKLFTGEATERDILDLALNGDISVWCNDPSFLYWGWQYKATQMGYSIEPETRRPKRNNVGLRGGACKHILAAIKSLPFYASTVVTDMRKAGILGDGVKKPQRIKRSGEINNRRGNEDEGAED